MQNWIQHKYHPLPVKSSRKIGFFWKIYDRFFTITTPRPSSKVKIGGERIYVGRFTDQMKAARAYDKAAKKYHGRFTSVNFGT